MTLALTSPQDLDQFALDRGLSYKSLAKEISRAAGYPVSHNSIYRFCMRVNGPSRRTLNAINKFVETQEALGKKKAGRQKGLSR